MFEKLLVTLDFDGVICRPPFGINPGSARGRRESARGTRNLLWWTEQWRYFGRLPMEGARDGLVQLGTLYDWQVVTARSVQARGITERWFRRYVGFVPVIHFRQDWHETSAQFKVQTIRRLCPVAHFEDDPNTADWLTDLGMTVFLVDWARNRSLRGERIHRIKQIADAIPQLVRLDTASATGVKDRP